MYAPGHPKAREEGCTCPREANQDGSGTFNRMQGSPHEVNFIVAEGCPLHGKTNWRESASIEGSSAA